MPGDSRGFPWGFRVDKHQLFVNTGKYLWGIPRSKHMATIMETIMVVPPANQLGSSDTPAQYSRMNTPTDDLVPHARDGRRGEVSRGGDRQTTEHTRISCRSRERHYF